MNSPIIAYRANMGVQTTAPFLNTYSLSFDGVDDYLDVGTDSSLDIFGSDFTISLWAKWGNQTTNSNGFINFGGSTNKALVGLGFGTEYGKISFGIGNSTSLSILYNMGSGYNDNQWHSIICKITSGVHAVYVDGVDITGVVFGGITVTNNNAIGGRSVGGQNRMFVGNIDEVSIYDKALTSEEITSVSTAPIDLTSLSPIAWYRNGDNGSYKSPQWLIPSNENKDKISNYSFEFDGVGDYIIAPLDGTSTGGVLPILDSDINLTVSLWFKRADTALKGIFQWGNNLTDASPFILIQSTSLGWGVFLDGAYLFSGNSSVGDWVNLIITRDSITNIWTVYANGVPSGTYDDGGTALSNRSSAQDIYLGNGYPNYFNGNIDEVAIWNTDETANIATIYNGGEPTTISGAVAHWRMGEDASFNGINMIWTVPDNVGSNNGTSANMTIEDRIGEAPNSSNNALSFNMDEVDRVTDVPT